MRVFANGREFDVRTTPEGEISGRDLRAALNVLEARTLVLQRQDGSNEVIDAKSVASVKPEDHFTDLPREVRGCQI